MKPQQYGYWLGFRRPQPDDIPEGWKLKRLHEMATFSAGGKLGLTMSDYIDSGFDAYSAEGQNGKVNIAEFEGPAVIVSSIGAKCGKCFYAGGKFTTLANVQVIFPDSKELNPYYLWNLVNDERFWPRYATAQPFIRPSEIKKSWIVVPSDPDEQAAMARVLGAADNALECTHAAISRARELDSALIHQLLRRGLRNETPQKSAAGLIPTSWKCEPLGQHIHEGPTNGVYRPESDYAAHGTPIVRIDSFADGQIHNVSELRRVKVEKVVEVRYALSKDDVLINRVNSLSHIGKAAIVPALDEPTIFESNMMRLRTGGKLLPEFLIIILRSDVARKHWLARAKPAVNQASVNQRDVRELPIPIPETDEQKEIVRIVSASTAHIERLEAVANARQTLKKSLMHDLLTGRVRVWNSKSKAA